MTSRFQYVTIPIPVLLIVQNVGFALRELLGKVDTALGVLPAETHNEVGCFICLLHGVWFACLFVVCESVMYYHIALAIASVC